MTSHSQEEVMIKLEDWFDPYNHEHMKAYEKLCNSGCWPEKFIPKHVYTCYLSTISIHVKIAQAWKDFIFHKTNIDGTPFEGKCYEI